MTMKFTIIEGDFTIIVFSLLLEAFIISSHWFLFVKGSFLFSSLRVIKLVPHARWLPCSQITLKTLKNPLWPKKEILLTIRKASSDLWAKFLHDDLVQLKYNELASWKIRDCILKSSWTSWSSHLCRPAPLGKLSLLKRLRFSIS